MAYNTPMSTLLGNVVEFCCERLYMYKYSSLCGYPYRHAVVLMLMFMLMYIQLRMVSTWGLCEHLGPHLMLGLRYLPPGEHRRAVKHLHGQGSGLWGVVGVWARV